jgi:hypothetical protein
VQLLDAVNALPLAAGGLPTWSAILIALGGSAVGGGAWLRRKEAGTILAGGGVPRT